MNRLLSVACCVLLLAASAVAQPAGNIGVYANSSGTQCDLYDLFAQVTQYYIVHSNSPAAQAARFRAPVPACMNGAVIVGETTMWPIKIGLVTDGTYVGYGGCLSGPIHVATLSIFGLGLTSECCWYPILPDPLGETGEIEIEGCDGVWYPANATPAVVNPTLACFCIVPTAVTTWGKVKALYSE